MTELQSPSPTFFLNMPNIKALGQWSPEGFIVLKGSEARVSDDSALQALLRSGSVAPTSDPDRLIFNEDTLFKTAFDATIMLVGSGTSTSKWVYRDDAGRTVPFGTWRDQHRATSKFSRRQERVAQVVPWLLTQQENLDRDERAYKLEGVAMVYPALKAFVDGGSAEGVTVQPQRSGLNQLDWRVAASLDLLLKQRPDSLRQALQILWTQPLEARRTDEFWGKLEDALQSLTPDERRPINGLGTRASVASYFLFLADPTGHPFYRRKFGARAVTWFYEDEPQQRRTSPGELLAEYVDRCQELHAAFLAAGLPFRDLLDTQSALFVLSLDTAPVGPGVAEGPVDALRAEFEAFRRDPVQQLRLSLRRRRAGELRTLLSEPADLTLGTFNREVWRYESETRLGERTITGQLDGVDLTPNQVQVLARALTDGALELHGNYLWGTSLLDYGASLSISNEEKVAHLHAAAQILNSLELFPQEKAAQLQALPGLGQTAATGLVMVFHPEEFAVVSDLSQRAIQTLGLSTQTVLEFENAAAKLLERVGGEDYLELDWFLTMRGARQRYWWVNQGQTYAEERQQGYVWASADSGVNIEHHENVMRLRPGDRIIHYAAQAIQAVGTVTAPPVSVTDELSSEVIPTKRSGYMAAVLYQPLTPPLSIAELPDDVRRADLGPFDKNGKVRQVYLWPLDPAVFQAVITPRPEPVGSPAQHHLPPDFPTLSERVAASGLRIEARTLRRYHLALQTRGFVILSGVSGTGKTWLAEAYARAAGAAVGLFPVAPNWTTNEDLLGFYSPLDGGHYHHTAFSRFLLAAGQAYREAQEAGQLPQPYHAILDEMNLARVEYYFAQFLSKMEIRSRGQETDLELGPDLTVMLPPNLSVIGTVNIDETTHDFANKVYDRAQLIEIPVTRSDLEAHLNGHVHASLLLEIWDVVSPVAPFAFRVMDDILAYQQAALTLNVDALEALDDALLQKVLPKLRGTDRRLLGVLAEFLTLAEERLPLSHAKAASMRAAGMQHGFVSFH
ncbi:AAA family ATPase [Deinococcus detaillensis]|nr:AAA family ATPase [Deinococcus detaillensis]